MNKGFLGLLAVLMVCSCSEKRESGVKAPTRVKTEVVSSVCDMAGQTFVGIVEEREGTAVSFTSMGIVKRVLVNEGQAVSRGQLIAEMDDTQARNLLSGAEAQMAQANDACTTTARCPRYSGWRYRARWRRPSRNTRWPRRTWPTVG